MRDACHQAADYAVDLDELMEKAGARIAELIGCESRDCDVGRRRRSQPCDGRLHRGRRSGADAAAARSDGASRRSDHAEGIPQRLRPCVSKLGRARDRSRHRGGFSRRARTAHGAGRGTRDRRGSRTAPVGGDRGGGPQTGRARDRRCGRRTSSPARSRTSREAQTSWPTAAGRRCADLSAPGLLLGRKDLVWAAFMNGAPHHAVGRMMKVGKEEIIGMVAAVEAHMRPRDGRGLPPVVVIPPGHQRRRHPGAWRPDNDAQARGRQSVSDDDHRVGSGAGGRSPPATSTTAARRRAADHVARHGRWLLVQRASAGDSARRSDAGGPPHRRGAAERAEGHSEEVACAAERRPCGTLGRRRAVQQGNGSPQTAA